MTPALFCHRCGHLAIKHAGEAGCTAHTFTFDLDEIEDCPCTQTYEAINPPPQEGAQAHDH